MAGRFNLDTVPIGQLLDDPEARAVLDELAPQISAHPMISFVKAMPFNQMVKAAANELPADVVTALIARLEAL